MIALIQRVSSARVEVENVAVGQIERGILALIGVETSDTPENYQALLKRILSYRIFPDNDDKMNLSLQDIAGGLLLVPQFTLVADTNKGNRPGFSHAASPTHGKRMFEQMRDYAEKLYPYVKYGVFGADMQVSLVNDGPATFWLQNT